jgi:sRNA-binding protein
MRSNKPDTFLLGHARRMRSCRMRQKQRDSEAYRNRVNTQKREHRLRVKHVHSTKHQTETNQLSTAEKRKRNRERQRRFQRNRSDHQKALRRAQDRNYWMMKQNAKHPLDPSTNRQIDVSNINPITNTEVDIPETNPKLPATLVRITPFVYRVSLQPGTSPYASSTRVNLLL